MVTCLLVVGLPDLKELGSVVRFPYFGPGSGSPSATNVLLLVLVVGVVVVIRFSKIP